MTGDEKQQGNGIEQSGQLLSELGGIVDAREVHARDKTTLEVILDAERKILANCPNDLCGTLCSEDKFNLCDYRAVVREDLAKLPEFTEQDLKEFIFANCNSDYSKDQKSALGIVSGCLIDILTERNKAKGKKTRFYVNGNGKRFDYLFLFANADELIVHNFIGTYVCGCIGNAHKVAVLGVNGYGTLAYPAHFQSNQIDTLLAVGVKSDNLLELWNDSSYYKHKQTGQILKIIGISVKGDEIIDANETTTMPDEIVLIGAWRKEPNQHTKKHPYLFGELAAKNIAIIGLNYDLFSHFHERVSEGSGKIFPKVEQLIYLKNVPDSLHARLQRIFYGGRPIGETTFNEVNGTSQGSTYSQLLEPENLSKILRDKTEDEIVRIVAQLSGLTNVGQRLCW